MSSLNTDLVKNFIHLEKILQETHGKQLVKDDISKFRKVKLPPIINRGDLSLFLGISPKKIFSICNDEIKANIHYRRFELRKKNGSRREIHAPRTYLKVVQWWILDNILNRNKISKNIFGFVPNRNIVQNAKFHSGASHILNVDIKDFFPSIDFFQVLDVFLRMGYSDDVSDMLANICCLDSRVPQGAPTSPAIGNLVLRDMDGRLTELSRAVGMKYSRYADDLTFSSKEWIETGFLSEVSDVVGAAGFSLNQKKTRFSGPQDRLEVTGVVINDKIQPPRRWRKRVRATLHSYQMKRGLTRRELSYLFGIVGVSGQYSGSTQMKALSDSAKHIIDAKRHTVIGYGFRPILSSRLTKLQAEALSLLSPTVTVEDMSGMLNASVAIVERRLQSAYKKINVRNMGEAMLWAKDNL